jgi:Na+/proline symporter
MRMVADSGVLLWVSIAYLAMVLGVSIWGFRKSKTEEDFLVAGRSIGPWVGGAAAPRRSAPARSGTLGRYYQTGGAGAGAGSVWAGWAVSAYFVAPKLQFGAHGADYVGTPFASERARTIATALIICQHLPAAQFRAIGEILRRFRRRRGRRWRSCWRAPVSTPRWAACARVPTSSSCRP